MLPSVTSQDELLRGFMGAPSVHEVTQLLRAWSAGDQAALDKLTPLVYQELHRAAKRYMGRQQPDHTLQTTALVNVSGCLSDRLLVWTGRQRNECSMAFSSAKPLPQIRSSL